ncbi:nucleotidyltransferase [Natroniella sulfidigena]|uniref:nucleotidyltransferase n=1 Tax=Natroniella sulfidigena TaxID=723921 RepID=UPI00200AA0BB|nr:nucleotidyltransferase [Natroniella sulfidigena]MCK8816938.1 nucleotidyltransferase [Natroniella sulfidigena]
MKVLGIITEYNPFHYGHQIHLNKSLTKSKADATICIMSGSFLQRGTPAIVNQWTRTKMALQQGVDLVIQLPVAYTTRSAQYFAYGAVKLLTATNIVDHLCFGSELGEIAPLKLIGQLLATEPDQLNQLIKEELTTGVSYPLARSKALTQFLKLNSNLTDISTTKLKSILINSNNILGLEYIRALTKLKSSIIPLTIKREGGSYHSTELQKIASASAIREQIKQNYNSKQPLLDSELNKSMPDSTFKILQEEFANRLGPIFYEDFTLQILTLLRRVTHKQLKNYEGVTGGLENRIKDAATKATSLSELIKLIKTKRFTQTRIQRILTQLLLDLNQEKLSEFESAGGPQYLRILGFNKQGRKLLKLLKEKADLPIITNLSNHFRTNQEPKSTIQKMLLSDIKANNIYSLTYPKLTARQGGVDFYRQPIILT